MRTRMLALAAAALVVGCGGGGGNAGGPVGLPPAPLPTPSPSPVPTSAPPAPFSAGRAVVIPQGTNAALDVALPAAGGFTGSLQLPAAAVPVASPVTLTETLADSPSTGVAGLQSVRRTSGSARPVASAAFAPLFYVGASSDTPFTLTSGIGLTVTAPSTLADPPGQVYYLAAYDSAHPNDGWRRGYAGPATTSGGTLHFNAPTSTFPVSGGTTYAFAVYRLPVTAQPPIVLNKIYFQFPEANAAPTFTASELGYSGAFSAALECSDASAAGLTVAAVSPASSTPASSGGPVSFTLSSRHSGACTATIRDANGTSASARVNVSETFVSIQ